MKTSFIKSIVFTAFVVWAPMAFAAELGDPAPALQVAEWVKGQPVDLATSKRKMFSSASSRPRGARCATRAYGLAAKGEDAAQQDKLTKVLEAFDKELGGLMP